ncbi:CIC11C00000002404 [Sungouiella intermedia]|uniref:CIC11C00000000949 n=1 Tax=Sungouiella intermedia TaxID=45354 RepID=A0A1L0CSY7_9ASCO|nr:CIC11C00000002404 [[Candida] intermedia]SGZ50523.1 CIC11C00000000949 [[Candida] intermedia]
MTCPLCGLELRQNLLLTSLAITVCSNEQCIYPFNMSMEQIQQKRLMTKTSEREIMGKMLPKLAGAQVDEKVASFMVKEDDLME